MSLMRSFNASDFYVTGRFLERLSDVALKHAKEVEGKLAEGTKVEFHPDGPKVFIDLVESVREMCSKADLTESSLAGEDIKNDIQSYPFNDHQFSALIRLWGKTIKRELAKQCFLQIPSDRAAYFDQKEPFGHEIYVAYPSARFDLEEASNCITVGNDTAGVFHYMRAVEWCLRTFCAHFGFRRVKAKIKKSGKVEFTPVEYSEWEKILTQLPEAIDKRLTKIRRGPNKQAQQECFYSVLQDIRAIKDAWRNHVMHVRSAYGYEDVLAVRSHVKRIMVTLQKGGIVEAVEQPGV